MTKIALFTTLAMAASGVAYAQPNVRVDVRAGDPIVYQRDRDHYDRYEQSHWHQDFHGRWTPLGRGFSAQNERQFIAVNGTKLRKLRLEGVRGNPMVTKVVIEFADRSAQSVDINSSLGGGSGEVIDLNGGTRRVNRVIVYTDRQARGTYSVYGA